MPIGGKNSKFKHGTDAVPGTVTDFSGKIIDFNLDQDAETVDATVWNDGFRQWEQSFKNAEITVQYKYDKTVYGQLGALMSNGTEIDWEFSPDGVATDDAKVEGVMFMVKRGSPVTLGDLLVVDCDYQVTGAVTDGVHP